MSDQVVILPDDSGNTGKKLDTSSLTVGANTVQRERMNIADPATAAALAGVVNSTPGASDYGLEVRTVGQNLTRANDGTNSETTLFDADTGGGTQYVRGVSVRAPASGGSTDIDFNSGTKSAATIRVVIATDQPQLTNKLLVTPDANSAVNVAQINGVTPLMGNGATGTGSQRVTIASDNTAFSVNATLSAETTKVIGVTRTADGSGNLLTSTSNALDVNLKSGSIANTGFGLTPQTSGGCSIAHVVSAASTNATNVKASAGQVYGWTLTNNAGYPVYVKLHNTAGTPTAGSGVVRTIGCQAGVTVTYTQPAGIAFGTGIGYTIVKDITDAGTTPVAASDCVFDMEYK